MTIAEVSKKYGLTADTLRYYEKIGLLPNVTRTAGGIRNYSEEDCRWIEFIKCMRSAGLSVDVLIEYVKLFWEGDVTIERRKNLLIEQRAILAEKLKDIQTTIERLDSKIANYDSVVLRCEKNLKGY